MVECNGINKKVKKMVNYNKLFSLFYYIGLVLAVILVGIIGIWIFSYLAVMAVGGLIIVVSANPVPFSYGGYLGTIVGCVFTIFIIWISLMYRMLESLCKMWIDLGEGIANWSGLALVSIYGLRLKDMFGE